ncbi:MAG: hypothetical protein NTY90_03505 [Candidatus Micrarchaeota archaeon]|nr:hypothetical protein [Candidatus Micrarchaeota archaeon]
MSFLSILGHAVEGYRRNLRLISIFSIPLLVTLPLTLFLPNFVALGGTFLRFGSIGRDISLLDASLIVLAFLVALLLFSFALVLINLLIRSQRTLLRLGHRDAERIESSTARLFMIFLAVFLVTLAFNFFLYEVRFYGIPLHTTLGALFGFVLAVAVIFTPQAIVIDDLKTLHAIGMGMWVIERKFGHFIKFLLLAAALLLVNTGVFLAIGALSGQMLWAKYAAIVVNSIVIVPFLEVLKTQIYLSKYTLLR